MFKVRLAITAVFFLSFSPVFAQQMNLRLMPKASKTVTNHYAWTLQATCTINAKQANSRIRVNVLRNRGRVNGKSLANGQGTSVNVHNHQSISVSAEPGTAVNIVNLSNSAVQAVCSA